MQSVKALSNRDEGDEGDEGDGVKTNPHATLFAPMFIPCIPFIPVKSAKALSNRDGGDGYRQNSFSVKVLIFPILP